MNAIRRVVGLADPQAFQALLALAIEHPELVSAVLDRHANYASCNSDGEPTLGLLDTCSQATGSFRSHFDKGSNSTPSCDDQHVRFFPLVPLVS